MIFIASYEAAGCKERRNLTLLLAKGLEVIYNTINIYNIKVRDEKLK